MTLGRLLEPYHNSLTLLENLLEEAINEDKLDTFLHTLHRPVYIGLLDAYRQVFAYSLFHPRGLPKPFVSSLKALLKRPENREKALLQAEQLGRSWTHKTPGAVMVLLHHFMKLLDENRSLLSDPATRNQFLVEVLYCPLPLQLGVDYLLPVWTTCRTGALFFWYQTFPELQEEFPYVQYTPDKQSAHRCSTHEDLFNQVFTLRHPLLTQLAPANGWNCKCSLMPEKSPTGNLWPEELPFTPDPERDDFKPMIYHSILVSGHPFHWLDRTSADSPVLLYKKNLTTRYRTPTDFTFSGKVELDIKGAEEPLDETDFGIGERLDNLRVDFNPN